MRSGEECPVLLSSAIDVKKSVYHVFKTHSMRAKPSDAANGEASTSSSVPLKSKRNKSRKKPPTPPSNIPGVQKLKASLRQTRRLLAKVPNSSHGPGIYLTVQSGQSSTRCSRVYRTSAEIPRDRSGSGYSFTEGAHHGNAVS
jgi:hypothetical protein